MTPGTKLAQNLEKLNVNTPNRRSTRNLKNETLASILTPQNPTNTKKSTERNLFTDLKDQFDREQTPASRTRSRSKSPARNSPARTKHAVKFDLSPDARFEVEDGDVNMEAEDVEENSENLPPSPSKTRSARRPATVGKKTKNDDEAMDVDEAPKEMKRRPIRLKKVPTERNTPIYRVLDTLKTPATRRPVASTSRTTKSAKMVVEVYSDEGEYSAISETEESEEEKSYTHEQIKDIICTRLSNAPDVAGKVNAANREAASVPRVAIVEALSRHAFILLRAAVSQVQSSGVEEFMFYELYRQYRVLCTQLEGIEPFHDYGIHHILMELCRSPTRILKPVDLFFERNLQTKDAGDRHTIRFDKSFQVFRKSIDSPSRRCPSLDIMTGKMVSGAREDGDPRTA